MEDKRIEKRKEFFNPVKDNKAEREKFMVDLRKKRKQELFRSKRILRIEEESENSKGTNFFLLYFINSNLFLVDWKSKILIKLVNFNIEESKIGEGKTEARYLSADGITIVHKADDFPLRKYK